jgi:hypothetical protein
LVKGEQKSNDLIPSDMIGWVRTLGTQPKTQWVPFAQPKIHITQYLLKLINIILSRAHMYGTVNMVSCTIQYHILPYIATLLKTLSSLWMDLCVMGPVCRLLCL